MGASGEVYVKLTYARTLANSAGGAADRLEKIVREAFGDGTGDNQIQDTFSDDDAATTTPPPRPRPAWTSTPCPPRTGRSTSAASRASWSSTTTRLRASWSAVGPTPPWPPRRPSPSRPGACTSSLPRTRASSSPGPRRTSSNWRPCRGPADYVIAIIGF